MRTRPAACFRIASSLNDVVNQGAMLIRDRSSLTLGSQAVVLLDRTPRVHFRLQEQGN